MRLKSAIVAGVAACALLSAPAHAAGKFVNGSFEDGFTGWVVDEDQVHLPGLSNHFDAFGDLDKSYDPIDGYYLASLQANQTDTPVVLSQTFTTVGGLFSGWAAFLGEDFLPWDDEGAVTLYRLDADEVTPIGQVTLFAEKISTVGDWGFTGWTQFSTRLEAGTYRLEAYVLDRNDDRESSRLILDNFAVAEVPEPATWALMITGFGAAGAALRRRKALA